MNHYARRDIENMEPEYSNHVSAMTTEDLFSKSDIAAELAYRDRRISLLEEALAELHIINHRNRVDAARRHGIEAREYAPHPLLAGKENKS